MTTIAPVTLNIAAKRSSGTWSYELIPPPYPRGPRMSGRLQQKGATAHTLLAVATISGLMGAGVRQYDKWRGEAKRPKLILVTSDETFAAAVRTGLNHKGVDGMRVQKQLRASLFTWLRRYDVEVRVEKPAPDARSRSEKLLEYWWKFEKTHNAVFAPTVIELTA